jgi:predicted GNAT family N-acyltransferase
MRVFVKEQGVPEEIELDEDDRRAIHFLALIADKAVGTVRVVLRHGSDAIDAVSCGGPVRRIRRPLRLV